MSDLKEMQVDELRREIGRAVQYRSGPGMMNTIYLGGMASAGIMSRLGARYGFDKMSEAIKQATPAQLIDVAEYEGFLWIYQHYVKAGRKLYDYEIIRKERVDA